MVKETVRNARLEVVGEAEKLVKAIRMGLGDSNKKSSNDSLKSHELNSASNNMFILQQIEAARN